MAWWRVEGSMMAVYDEEGGNELFTCEHFGVSTVIVDMLTGKHRVQVFVDSPRSGLNRAIVSRSAISKRRVMSELYEIGLAVLDDDELIPVVQEILLTDEADAPIVMQHDRLGFSKVDNQRVFLLDEPIGLRDPIKSQSRFSDPVIMKPRGTLMDWITVMQREVLGHPTLELALAVGAVAPVAHLLKEAHAIIDLPIVAYIGTTTTGKTSAMRVGASIWGYPVESVGIIDDLHSTENAFFATLAHKVGVPSFIDETSAQPEWDFVRMLYFLPKGRSKRRCDAAGGIRSQFLFSGAVVFTGERSLLTMAEKNTGLSARVLELAVEKWTEDDQHAERIQEGCCRNYGTAAPILMQWLMEHESLLPELFATERRMLNESIGEVSGVEGRVVKIAAMILVAAYAMKEALQLNLSIGNVRALLAEQIVGKRPEQDWLTSVYSSLQEQIAVNGSKFTWPNRKMTDHPSGKDVWGLFGYHKAVPCVWIGRECFEKRLLPAAKVQEPKEVTRAFSDRGWLVDFGDRHYYCSHNINGVRISAYCLLLPEQPNLFERLEQLPGNASGHDMLKALRGESFEACVLTGESGLGSRASNSADEEEELMAFGMVRPCAQGETFVINRPLARELGLQDEAFITVLEAEKLLFLSTNPVGKTAQKIVLKKKNELIISKSRIFKKLAAAMKLDLQLGEGIAFNDINTEKLNGVPIAVINIDLDNPLGVIRGDVGGWELPDMNDFEYNRASGKADILLADDEEEDS